MGQPRANRLVMPLIGALLVATLAVPTRAASPSPSATDLVPPDEVRFSAWLDQPLPESVPSGASITIGAFLADSTGRVGLSGTAIQAKLHSASPDVDATVAPAVEDWPGHVTTTIAVPAPIGQLEFILPGSSCDASGCTPSNVVIPVGGLGPPPGVAVQRLATAFVDAPTQIVPVGIDATLGFSVQPRIDWPAPGLVLPTELWLQVRIPQGTALDDVAAHLDDRATGHYTATLRFPTPGDYVVQVATVRNGGRDDLFSTGIRRITAEDDAAASPAPSLSPGAQDDRRDQLPGWVGPALAISGLVAVVLLVFGRRRGPDTERR